MTPKEYTRYTEELKANGYTYHQDTPYEGRNFWLKYPDGTGCIQMEVYHGINAEGFEYYYVHPYAKFRKPDCECTVRLEINFDTINITDIESMYYKYSALLT